MGSQIGIMRGEGITDAVGWGFDRGNHSNRGSCPRVFYLILSDKVIPKNGIGSGLRFGGSVSIWETAENEKKITIYTESKSGPEITSGKDDSLCQLKKGNNRLSQSHSLRGIVGGGVIQYSRADTRKRLNVQ